MSGFRAGGRDLVLVLDFGARGMSSSLPGGPVSGMLAQECVADITAERVRSLNRSCDPLRRAVECLRTRGTQVRPGHLQAGIADPGDLLRDATGLRSARCPKVDAAPAREFGRAECRVLDPSEPLFRDVPHETIVWMSHGDQLHGGLWRFCLWLRRRLVRSRQCGIMNCRSTGFSVSSRGLPTRPTARSSWVTSWTGSVAIPAPGRWKHSSNARLRRSTAGLGMTSGSFADYREASTRPSARPSWPRPLGPRVVCVFVDLRDSLRLGERASVATAFGFAAHECRAPGDRCVDRFFEALQGVVDPQEKRRRIGHVFIDVFRDEASPSIPALPGSGYSLSTESGGALRRAHCDHQDPPQRRGYPRSLAGAGHRAVARSVQGRSPTAGARVDYWTPWYGAILSRAGPGRALFKSDGRAAGGPAPGRRHLPG